MYVFSTQLSDCSIIVTMGYILAVTRHQLWHQLWIWCSEELYTCLLSLSLSL